MSAASTGTERVIRQGFKRLNRLMLYHWRLGLGSYINFWPQGIGRFVVLTHMGRKSGRTYRTPVNYAEIDAAILISKLDRVEKAKISVISPKKCIAKRQNAY